MKEIKITNIFFSVVIGCAFAGFFVGTTHEEPGQWNQEITTAAHSDQEHVITAVSYLEMDARKTGPNKNWKSHLKDLKSTTPDVLEPVPVQTLEMKLAALQDRAKTRAYNGAPPVVPHTIDQSSTANCLSCHETGLKVGDQIASKISHPHLTNCTQCHAPSQNNMFPPVLASSNSFEGLETPVAGERAWSGAPPVMPHSQHMRTDCTSCHGVNGKPGLRTTHPERQSCTQCHAQSATLNQQPIAFNLQLIGSM